MAAQRGDRWWEPAARCDHSTAVVDNELFFWGGYEEYGRAMSVAAHDEISVESRLQFYNRVEVFDVNTGCWEQRTTRGTPPLGVFGYSCVAVRNELHYFGGRCGHSGCYYNSVHTLSTSTLQWRMLAPSTTESGAPMQKHFCGMVHFTDREEDLLYIVGGQGPATPSSPQHGAEYQQIANLGNVRTNEQHIFSLSTNEWSSVPVTGHAPPPCDDFTLTTVGINKAIMFGGRTKSTSFSDDSFVVDLGKHSVNWTKIKQPVSQSVQWPAGRYGHTASRITDSVFVMIGGSDESDEYALSGSDVWLCDSSQWKELPTPLVAMDKRSSHSTSTFQLGPRCVWVLVFGGFTTYCVLANTVIIELFQDTDGVWCLGRVMERETLSNNTEYQLLRDESIKRRPLTREEKEYKLKLIELKQLQQQREKALASYQMNKKKLEEEKEALDSYQKRIRDMEEEVKVLNDRLHQDQVKQQQDDVANIDEREEKYITDQQHSQSDTSLQLTSEDDKS